MHLENAFFLFDKNVLLGAGSRTNSSDRVDQMTILCATAMALSSQDGDDDLGSLLML